MAKRPVRKVAKKKSPPTMKAGNIRARVPHKCIHEGCKNPSVMMRTNRKTKKKEHFCGKHWINDVELTPEFQKKLADFKKWEHEFREREAKRKAEKPKKKVVRKKVKK